MFSTVWNERTKVKGSCVFIRLVHSAFLIWQLLTICKLDIPCSIVSDLQTHNSIDKRKHMCNHDNKVRQRCRSCSKGSRYWFQFHVIRFPVQGLGSDNADEMRFKDRWITRIIEAVSHEEDIHAIWITVINLCTRMNNQDPMTLWIWLWMHLLLGTPHSEQGYVAEWFPESVVVESFNCSIPLDAFKNGCRD